MKITYFAFFYTLLFMQGFAGEPKYEFGKIEWTHGFKHKTVEFRLATADGVPCPKVEIRAWSESGYNSGISNEDGIAVVECGEAELIRVEVGRQIAWRKMFWQKNINILNGAKCYIEVKKASKKEAFKKGSNLKGTPINHRPDLDSSYGLWTGKKGRDGSLT